MSVSSKVPLGTIAYLGSPYVIMDPFCWSLAQLLQFNSEYVCGPDDYIHLDRSTTTDRSLSRNQLAKRFLGDWLLMLDVDHTFDPDLVLRLLCLFESKNLDVLSGVYVSKDAPYPPLLQWRENATAGWKLIAGWPRSARLVAYGRGGAGCLLVRRRVFERIACDLAEDPFVGRLGMGEDFSFYDRLERLGLQPYAATQVHLDHLYMGSVNYSNFKPNALDAWKPPAPVSTFFTQPAAT